MKLRGVRSRRYTATIPRQESVRRERITVISVNTGCHGEAETRDMLINMMDIMAQIDVPSWRAGATASGGEPPPAGGEA